MKRRSIVMALFALVALAGCAGDEVVGSRSEAILNGTPWDGDAIGFAYGPMAGCTVTGVFLTPRHFLIGGCFDDSDLVVFIRDGSGMPMPVGTVVDTLVGPVITGASPTPGNARILVLDADTPITMPARLADAAPTMDDAVTLVGFGDEGGGSSGQATVGDFTVTSVTDMDAQFTMDPVGDVRACLSDVAVFNGAGELTGITYAGTPDSTSGCFSTSTAFSIAGIRDFIDTSLAMPLPGDAGTTDGGDDGGVVPDAAAGDAAAGDSGATDGGTSSGSGDDGGCGCDNVGRGPTAHLGWLVLGALFLYRRRRTIAASSHNS